jgi:hypothetical protein
MVQHDDGCAIFQRQACNYVPDISVVPADGGTVTVIDDHGGVSKVLKQ